LTPSADGSQHQKQHNQEFQMKFSHKYLHGLTLVAALALGACGGGGGSKDPDPGILNVTVTDADTVATIEGARIQVTDGGTGDPITVLTTNAEGKASMESTINRSVLLRVSAQGYSSSPATLDQTPLPFNITLEQTTSASIQLAALADAASRGSISGSVKAADTTSNVANALIICAVGSETQATTSASDGTYVVSNVLAGTADCEAWKAGHNFSVNSAITVIALTNTPDVDFVAASAATATINGKVKFLATANDVVDVTLIDPETQLPIPGLQVFNTADTLSFTMPNVPDGLFNITASFNNDGFVLDPDSLVKFGITEITIAGGAVTNVRANGGDSCCDVTLDVTDTVEIFEPIDTPDLSSATAPVFKWRPYPATKDYVVEVKNENGEVIWGGFDTSNIRRFTVDAKDATHKTVDAATGDALHFATFNEDFNATASLMENRTYQVRIYSSVDDTNPLGYSLQSSSEDLLGLFRIVAP
jgi:hypothetical protein